MPNDFTTILLVEDNLPDALYTRELLPSTDYIFVDAPTLALALNLVDAEKFDVVLLDLSLPDSHGLETLDVLTSHCKVPIVVLTGLEDVQLAVESLKLGARDYIVKSRLTPEALARSISYAIESTKVNVVEAQLLQAEQSLRLALASSHTGVWARTFDDDHFVCDKQARALFGVDEKFGLAFVDFLKVVHPDDRDVLIYATTNSQEFEIEYRAIWPDESIHWIGSRGKTSKDACGKPLRAAGICVDIDARKRSEHQRSELAAIVESSDAAIISKTLDNIVTTWNYGAERIYGYVADEMIGQSIAILFADDVQIAMDSIHQRVARGEHVDQYESRRVRKDGTVIVCAITISPLKDERGTIIGLSTIARDITKQKRLERLHAVQNAVTILLLESASLSEAVPTVIRLIAEALQFTIGQMWQVDPLENVLRNVGEWHASHCSYQDFCAISRHLTFSNGNDLVGGVWRTHEPVWNFILKDSSSFSRALVVSKTELRYGFAFPVVQDNVLGVIEFFSDKPSEFDPDVQEMMTNVCAQLWQFMNRKLAEETINQGLQTQRSISLAIVENAPIGIAKLSKKLQFNEVNSAFKRQFGVSIKELEGKSIFEVMIGLPVEDLLKVVRDGTTLQAENVQIAFEGIPFDTINQDTCWDLAAWPVREASGAITGVVLITANVTERAMLVRQREDFVATLTHDLKNPLIGQDRVLGLFLAGAIGTLADKQLELVRVLKTSTSDMLGLIGTLLEVYRYDAGIQHLRLEEFDIRELINACVEQARPAAEEKNISLDLDATSTFIIGDKTAIRRVVMNLLDNAIKFARVKTVISVTSVSEENSYVFRIADAGLGINSEQLATLFKRYSQTEHGRSFSASTGLGLFLCRQIVEQHGGKISCESEVGKGTTLTVSLPIKQGGAYEASVLRPGGVIGRLAALHADSTLIDGCANQAILTRKSNLKSNNAISDELVHLIPPSH